MIKKIADSFYYRTSIYLSKFNFLQSKKNVVDNLQKKYFDEFGISYEASIRDYLELVRAKNINLTNDMVSQHILFLIGLRNKGFKPKRILEIGTHTGETTVFLSLLFSNAEIDTLDLPISAKDKSSVYSHKGSAEEIESVRKRNLNQFKNIRFHAMNSLQLLSSTTMYDLIWLDGAHGYPVVSIDIMNSLRLLNKNGYLLCDDVLKKLIKSDPIYESVATFEILEALRLENLLDVKYIFKRTNLPSLVWENRIKYIAVLRK